MYQNILVAFGKSGRPNLRLLFVSGGLFSGPFEKSMPEMTMIALGRAFESLKITERNQMMKAENIELCIYWNGGQEEFIEAR